MVDYREYTRSVAMMAPMDPTAARAVLLDAKKQQEPPDRVKVLDFPAGLPLNPSPTQSSAFHRSSTAEHLPPQKSCAHGTAPVQQPSLLNPALEANRKRAFCTSRVLASNPLATSATRSSQNSFYPGSSRTATNSPDFVRIETTTFPLMKLNTR